MKNLKYSIDHFSITVSSLKKSIEFYRQNFGFQEIKRDDKPDLQIKTAKLQLGDSHLELIKPYNQEPRLIMLDSEKKSLAEILEESSFHLAFSVDKIHSAYLALKDNKVEFETPFNEKFFFCKDPDGYPIEIRQR